MKGNPSFSLFTESKMFLSFLQAVYDPICAWFASMGQSLSSKGTDTWSEISLGIPTGISVRVPMDMLVGISPEISTGIRKNSVKKTQVNRDRCKSSWKFQRICRWESQRVKHWGILAGIWVKMLFWGSDKTFRLRHEQHALPCDWFEILLFQNHSQTLI